MENTNIFEQASRDQLRFKTINGYLNTEDLWNLKLEDLDKLAISLNKEIKEAEEGSFLKAKTVTNKVLTLKFDVVKHIITVRMAEEEAKKLKKQKQQEKAKILEIIGRKQEAALENKTIEELTAMVEGL